jgi:hypothetical protein
MTVEKQIFETLRALVDGRVYPDVAPEGVARPYVTYQQVGGVPVNFVDGGIPGMRNARFRVNVWDDRRATVTATCVAVEHALRNDPALQTTVMTNPVALNDPETRLRGTSQDFSVWFPLSP